MDTQGRDTMDIKFLESKCQDIIDIVEKRLMPFKLSEKQKSVLRVLARKYDGIIMLDCIDIGITKYIEYDSDNVPTNESVENFIDKLGGIAFNKTRSPIDNEVVHIMNICKNQFDYWNPVRGKEILYTLIVALRKAECDEDTIAKFLRDDVIAMTWHATSWTTWRNAINRWLDNLD